MESLIISLQHDTFRSLAFLQETVLDKCNILICMQKHSQHNQDEWIHFFRKTYLSLYSKGLRKGYCVRGESETEQNCNTLTPSSSGYNSTSFSFSRGCSTSGPGGLASAGTWFLLLELQQLTPNSDFQVSDFLSHRVI